MTSLRTKLTDAVVRAATLTEGKKDVTIWDADVTGFGLRLRPGQKTFIVAFRPAGAGRSANWKRLRLGTPETISTTAEARALARAALGKVAGGIDIAAQRKIARQRQKTKLSDLLDRYEKDLERRQYVNRVVVMSGLRSRLAPHLSDDIGDVSGAQLAAIVERLAREGKSGASEDFRSRCRAFFSWCVTKAKAVPSNPFFGFRKERATRADRLATARNGRALSDGEIVRVWNAASPTTTFGRFIRFLILTGCRRGEGAGLTREMVDRLGQLITLPPTFTKQGRPHLVPVAPGLEAVLEACPEDARSNFVFASPKTGGAMSGWNSLVEKLAKAADVHFTLHDLRRTFRTGLSRLGVETGLAELAIGHARAELEQIYNRNNALDVLREVFQKWDAHISGIVAQAKAKAESEAMGVFG